jgi:hypothetical protein
VNTRPNFENLSCGRCGRPTPYRLIVAGEAKPCCGRLQCEAWARDGSDIPAPSGKPSIEANELRRRYDMFLIRVVEGVEILAKTPSPADAEIARAVAHQLKSELLAAIVSGAPEVTT